MTNSGEYERSMGCSRSLEVCDPLEGDLPNCTSESFCGVFAPGSACENLAFRFTADLAVSTGGTYDFRLNSDAGSRLKVADLAVDAHPLVDNDGVHAAQVRTSAMPLRAGTYAVELEYFLTSGDSGLRLDYRGPDTLERWVPVGDAASLRSPDQAPRLSLGGGDPIYVLQGSAWREPGVICADAEDPAPSVQYVPPSTEAAGSLVVRYECSDSLRHRVSASRTVVVRAGPTIALLGQGLASIGLGQDFADPGACCQDFEGAALNVSSRGPVDPAAAGRYSRVYRCADPHVGASATALRVVTVDHPPVLALVGSATQRVIKGSSYVDSGMRCQDAEDGEIAWSVPSAVQVLGVAGVGSSEGAARYTCDNCLAASGSSTNWVRADLGDVRVVHGLRLRGAPPGLVVRVGSSPAPRDEEPVCLALGAAADEITCRSPLAGRYVTLAAAASPGAPALVLCGLQVLGASGPGPPEAFTVVGDGCSDLEALEGEYELSGAAGGHPEYRGPAGSALRRAAGAGPSGWWSLTNGSAEVARLLSAGPLVSAAWELPDEWPRGCRPGLRFDPADACTWLFGFSSSGFYQCADGHECPCSPGAHCVDTCCGAHGGLARCPADRAQLCEDTVGTSHVCAVNCTLQGGVRKCREDTAAGAARCDGNCAAKVETTGSVNTSQDGNHSLFLSCVDSLGQRAGLARQVEVACEGPNPGGTYGGNKLNCQGVLDTLPNVSSAGDCAEECLGSALCEAYAYEGGACELLNLCDKRYYKDDNTLRQVGYCQTFDYPPTLLVNSGPCCVNVGEAYNDSGAICRDLEDLSPPEVAAVVDVNVSTPGNYAVRYSCADTAGQSAQGSRVVTVKADCPVPMGVANTAAAGACREGALPLPHGGRCTLQCAPGFAPSTGHLTCTTSNDTDYRSRWDTSFVCGPSPCAAPSVEHVKQGARGGQACAQGYQVPSGFPCTPNCLGDGWPSYVPTEGNLSCDHGVLSPATFRCRLPASRPDYVLCAPAFVDAELSWRAGPARPDCSFERWHVQARCTSGPARGWRDLADCPAAAPRQQAREGPQSCRTFNLTEGATYEFRAREVCGDAAMTGPWGTTAPTLMSMVPSPEVLFVMPSADVTSDPGQVMVALSQACRTVTSVEAGAEAWVNVSQSGEHCLGGAFGLGAADITVQTFTGSGVQLAGERILIISGGAAFFAKGCSVNVSLGPGLLRTVQEPAKPSPAFSWNFTFVDLAPELVLFTMLSSLTDGGTFRVQWSEPAVFNCTASPSNRTICEQKASWEGDVLDAVQECEPGHAGPVQQLSAAAWVVLQVSGLYPGVDYQVRCEGHKLDKPWIPTLPTPTTRSGFMGFKTDEDTSREVGELVLQVFALCGDGRTNLIRTESLRQAELAAGYVVQVLDYKISCRNGTKLAPGEQARLQVRANTSALTSGHKRISWLSGPAVDVVYTAPAANETAAEAGALLLLRVCPPAGLDPVHYPCQHYELRLRALDVTFTFDGDGFQVREPGPNGLPLSSSNDEPYLVGMGAVGELPVSSDPSFDWSAVSMHLGSSADIFRLPTRHEHLSPSRANATRPLGRRDGGLAGRLVFRLHGQGTSLPLKLAWQGATFLLPARISFVPLAMTAQPVAASLLAPTQLEVEFSGVPDCGQLPQESPPVPWEGGFASPAKYVQLLALKSGRPEAENLCEGGTVFQGPCWQRASCSLAPAALDNITVTPLVFDGAAGAFRALAAAALPGLVSYPRPVFTGLLQPGAGGGPVDLGALILANSSEPRLALLGAGLPRAGDLRLGGARFGGYRLELEGRGGERIGLCSRVDWVAAGQLSCALSRCINITALPAKPRVYMFLGDLEAERPVQERLVLPRPEVLEIGPRDPGRDPSLPPRIGDTGPGRVLWFRGRHFAEANCSHQQQEVQLVGPPGGVQVFLGPQRVPCHARAQNATYFECEVRGRLMDAIGEGHVGDGLPPVQRSALRQIEFVVSEQLPVLNTDPQAGLPALQAEVVLTPCPDGMRREHEASHVCVECQRGRYVTSASAAWPLRCDSCPEGKYQDQPGASGCKDCPSHTRSPSNAVALTDCLCEPGYYSPYLNATTGAAASGTACLACHGPGMTDAPGAGEHCRASIPLVSACDARVAEACVADAASGAARLCKAYCPGGTSWPRAKRKFQLLGNAPDPAPGERGLQRHSPRLVRCKPPEACTGDNRCSEGYKGTQCDQCVFGYWRDLATSRCVPCSADQGAGEVLLAAMAVVMVFGGLAGASLYMRFQADIQFAEEMLTLLEAHVLAPMKSSTLVMRLLGRGEERRVLTVHSGDVGRSFSYAKTQDLGMVFRVDEQRVAHLAGVALASPMRGRVRCGWKLQTVNGQRLSCRSEEEVQALLREASLPLRLTFSAPRKWGGDAEGAELDFTQDRKMLFVLLGVMNAFAQVATFDFRWPPVFVRLAELAKKLTINLNFFRPECSVEMPFVQKWLYFLAVPYAVVVPLLAACGIASVFTLSRQRGPAFFTKAWLLMNALARCVCLAFIFLLPFHLDQLLVPFACVKSGTLGTVVSAMPETRCSLRDPDYLFMFRTSALGLAAVLAFFAALLLCLRLSFQWQGGRSRARDYIPFYVAMVEVSTFGQRGYVPAVRNRVFRNVYAARAFEPEAWKMERRELLAQAADKLGQRSRRVQQASARARLREGAEGAAGEEEGARGDMRRRVRALQGKQRFQHDERWPEVPDGNVVTYGWVLIVNLFWRQLTTLVIIKLTKNNLVVIGAGFQMIVFGINGTLLMCFEPYQSKAIVNSEGVLLLALFIMLWSAVLKDLLENHNQASTFADSIAKVNTAIEALAVVLVGVVILLPLYQVFLAGKKLLDITQGPEATLNKLYMMQYTKKETERKEADLNRLKEVMDCDKNEDTVKILATKLPQLDEAMAGFKETGQDAGVDQREQRRLLVRLAKVVRRMEDGKQKRRELQFAVDDQT